MPEKSGNNVKPPVHPEQETTHEKHTVRESLTEQHHGEGTESPQDDRRIGQHQGTGRPPLMKK